MSMTLRDLKQMAETAFTKIGSPSPETDAEQLICYYFACDRSYIVAHYRDPFDEARCQGFFELVDRRAQGEPVQHIIGESVFMGLPFRSSPDALIPRQETELLVSAVLDHLQKKKAHFGGFDVLDLCTGSGCIAVSLAKLSSQTLHVTASDLSETALRLAEQNVSRHGVNGKVHLLQGNLFAPFPTKSLRHPDSIGRTETGRHLFDCIVSNPPYIPTAVISTLRTEVKDHEPLMALDGGETGLDFYRRILAEAPTHLKPGALLAMEIGAEQGLSLQLLAEQASAYNPLPEAPTADGLPLTPSCGSFIFRDLAGRDRLFLALRK